MGYELHIEAKGHDGEDESTWLPLADWERAVEATPNVRLATGDMLVLGRNPRTGEEIGMPRRPGTAEWQAEPGTWWPVFFHGRGSVSFKPGRGMTDDPAHPLRVAVAALARALDADIRGDEGELYDW